MKQFTLGDLEVGYLVEYRNGDIAVVLPNNIEEIESEFIFVGLDGFMKSSTYTNHFKEKEGYILLDIAKVYGHPTDMTAGLFDSLEYRPILFDEDNIKKISTKDVEKLKAIKFLFPEYKWIAKDKDNYVYIYTNKPIKSNLSYIFGKNKNQAISCDGLNLDCVSWEDDEASLIDDLLKRATE